LRVGYRNLGAIARRGCVLVLVVAAGALLHTALSEAPETFARWGSIYDCPPGTLDSGGVCVKYTRYRLVRDEKGCPFGWVQSGKVCVWKRQDADGHLAGPNDQIVGSD
jgi:hypothetical protein